MTDSDNTSMQDSVRRSLPAEVIEKLGLYELMVHESSDVIWIMDLNLRTTYMSPSVEKHLGYTVEEYMGLSLSERLPSESVKLSQRIFQTEILPVVNGEKEYDSQPIIYEMLHRHKNGQNVWGEISFSFIRDKSGKIVSIMGITRNIDARKRAQEELAKSRERFRMLVENTNDWVWEIDSNYNFIYTNPLVESITGFSADKIIGKSFFDFCEPANRNSEFLRFENFRKSAIPFSGFRISMLDANKRAIHLEVNASPITDTQGNFFGFRGISRDVSQSQLILKKLSRLESRHMALLIQSDFAIIELDQDFEVLEWSKGAARIFGYSKGEAMVGKIFTKLWNADSFKVFLEKVTNTENGSPSPFVHEEKKNHNKSGLQLHCKWYVNPLFEDEKLRAIQLYVKNLTDNSETEMLLNQYEWFMTSYCRAVVFVDTRLKINGFSPSSPGYLSKPEVELNKVFVRNLFEKTSAKTIIDQGINYATRNGKWSSLVFLHAGAAKKQVSLEIVKLLNANSKSKGFAFIFDKKCDTP